MPKQSLQTTVTVGWVLDAPAGHLIQADTVCISHQVNIRPEHKCLSTTISTVSGRLLEEERKQQKQEEQQNKGDGRGSTKRTRVPTQSRSTGLPPPSYTALGPVRFIVLSVTEERKGGSKKWSREEPLTTSGTAGWPSELLKRTVSCIHCSRMSSCLGPLG
jgi:hypothetical protein